MRSYARATALVAGLLAATPALAETELNATIGSTRVQDSEEASGPMLGLHGAWDFGSDSLFGRLAGSFLRGDLDRERPSGGSRGTTSAEAGFRGLVGTRLDAGVGLYTGLGYRQFDSEFDATQNGYFQAGLTSGNVEAEYVSSLQTLYLPVGLVGESRLRGGWQARTRLEVAMPLTTREQVEIPDALGGGNETFTRTGGAGGQFSIRFQRDGLGITPYVRAYDLPEADTETVNGNSFTPDDHRTVTAGIRIGLTL